MKKLNYLLFVTVVALAFVGCRKTAEVSFTIPTQEMDAQGGSIETMLKSNGEWTINSTAEWIIVSPMSGKGDATLTLTAEANTTGEDRATTITATTKDNTASLIVMQEAVAQPQQYYLTVTPRTIHCGSDGGEFTVEVSSNIDWTVTTPQWITCLMEEGSNDETVTLIVSPIDGEFSETRVGEVRFGSSLAYNIVYVVQRVGPVMGIDVTPKNLDFISAGETKTVTVTTEDAWTASLEVDWVTLGQVEGQGDAEISVTLTENPNHEERQTIVTFNTVGGIQAMLGIWQEASPDSHFLEVSPLEFQFGKEGGQRDIVVGCDTEWEFALSDDWLSLSQSSGEGNATVVLTAAPNLLTESRTSRFYLKSGDLSYELNAIQAPGDSPLVVDFNTDTLFFAYTGGLQPLSLTSNTSWQLQVSEWISLLTNSGQGDASFDIIVDGNQSPQGRIGFVNAVHNGQVLATVIVVQEGKPNILETDITDLEVRPEGGSYDIQVTANQSWTVNTDVEWLQFEPQSGFGNKILTITVDPLVGVRPRTGHVKVSGETGNQVTITVNQHQ